MTSLGVCMNVFNEGNAISGALESAAQYADDICIYHTGPGGEYSTDGTIEIAEKFGARIVYGSIDDGFGVVRSRMVRMCETEFVAILDADERLHRFCPRLRCHGTDSYDVGKHYPELVDVNLSVEVTGVYDQIAVLKSLMRPEFDAIVTSRRHYQTLGFDRPSQNWHLIADWQARIVRNCEWVQYRSAIKMHEQIHDVRTGQAPRWYQPTPENVEIFQEHHHLFFKRCEREQRAHDIAIYDSLCENRTPPTLAEFRNRDGMILEPTGDVA